MGIIRNFAGAGAAIVACALGASAWAQSTASVQAGLDRAVRPPLEIIWLQSDIQSDLWRSPSLAQSLQECARAGAPKEGCAVRVRSAWRYTFDARSSVIPAPIVLSSLKVTDGVFPAGRMSMSGSGRMYLVTSGEARDTAIRPPSGAILLAAGSTVQLVDTAYPSIQIELRAPDDHPLFLGNLSEADVTQVVALLVRQAGLVNASAAQLSETGQVALHIPAPAAPAPLSVASVDLGALAGKLDVPQGRQPSSMRDPLEGFDGTVLVAALEQPVRLAESFSVAAVDLNALFGRLDVPVHPVARSMEPQLINELTHLAAALEQSYKRPQAFDLAAADLGAVAGHLDVPAVEPQFARNDTPGDFSMLAAAIEQSAKTAEARRGAPPAQPAQLAAEPPPPPSDLAKMRAEVEAEIARERERMAQALQQRSGARFRFGT